MCPETPGLSVEDVSGLVVTVATEALRFYRDDDKNVVMSL